eukprot:CAMPEP_0183711074 /NCGR_PEP_ID=MMETSP0737-20130205/6663_1 /TAXON_ID=385413 /ORGANISM="Thalassiosira miniscula, Strain CCMP1093" /LENGTH=58 /DNA_ID=CAMNT_0025939485 /DNA_START=1 /DNA_END=174 /DNA_ORIENTATION=-
MAFMVQLVVSRWLFWMMVCGSTLRQINPTRMKMDIEIDGVTGQIDLRLFSSSNKGKGF